MRKGRRARGRRERKFIFWRAQEEWEFGVRRGEGKGGTSDRAESDGPGARA